MDVEFLDVLVINVYLTSRYIYIYIQQHVLIVSYMTAMISVFFCILTVFFQMETAPGHQLVTGDSKLAW